MDVRVEYYCEPETGLWGFSVPSLRITGGGAATRAEAEEQVCAAILFTLEGDGDVEPLPGGEVGHVRITVPPSGAERSVHVSSAPSLPSRAGLRANPARHVNAYSDGT